MLLRACLWWMQHLWPGCRLISAQLPAQAKLKPCGADNDSWERSGGLNEKQWGWWEAADLVTLSCHACIYHPSVSCRVTRGGTLLCSTYTVYNCRAYFSPQTKAVRIQKWHLVRWSKLLPPGFLWVVKLPEKPDIFFDKRYSSETK